MGEIFDFASYLRFVAALAFVLGLILVAAHVAKKVMAGRAYAGPRAQGRRLGIVEVLTMDTRHRLFLIRRDGVEHLVMTGPDGALLIENGIDGLASDKEFGPVQQSDAPVSPLHGDPAAPPAQNAALRKVASLFGDRRA
ncbi:FliO/MopB family protein [Hwanghaeella sp.]|uniref:FliO/MopB family protein n=1 Tax=Hwanghaeella sp. TaxID=2605943 RepID=UPI003CCC345E